MRRSRTRRTETASTPAQGRSPRVTSSTREEAKTAVRTTRRKRTPAVATKVAGWRESTGTPAKETRKETRPRESASALNTRAFQLQKEGRHDEAEALLRRALELKPNYAYALYNLGWSLVAQGKAIDALGPLTRSAEMQPTRWEPLQRLSEAYALLGETEKAQEYADKAQTLRKARGTPDSPGASRLKKQHVVSMVSEAAFFTSTDKREVLDREQTLAARAARKPVIGDQ